MSQSERPVEERFNSSWQATWYTTRLWFVLLLCLNYNLYHKHKHMFTHNWPSGLMQCHDYQLCNLKKKGVCFWICSQSFTRFLTLQCYKWTLTVEVKILPQCLLKSISRLAWNMALPCYREHPKCKLDWLKQFCARAQRNSFINPRQTICV